MKIFNTLTKKKEEFEPLRDGEVRIYSCGPTVYSYAHIGNLRTYIFMDLLRKVLKKNGYKLRHVMNITDVGHLTSDGDEGEDKMEKAAAKQKKSPYEIAEYYTGIFFRDLKRLNIERPEITPKATDHIPQMIEFVEALCEKGYGYETSDGIYFDISKFKDYGKLSGISLEDQKAGARVLVNDEKRNPADFALWKKAPKEHIMQWESPWGMGYPGWHIECSAMSRQYLGDVFDIHTGGVDHIPIHHENEIAQSEALLGRPAVRYWMHGEFLLVDNGKMSKSLGNTYTIDDLKDRGFDPLDYRYFCLNGHYRNKLNFTWDALKAARTALERLYEAAGKHKGKAAKAPEEALEGFRKDFYEAVFDDLNIPLAMGVVWNAARYLEKSNDIYEFLLEADEILSLDIGKRAKDQAEEEATSEDIPAEIKEMAERRAEAKKSKNYALADELRGKITAAGYVITDTKEGFKITKA